MTVWRGFMQWQHYRWAGTGIVTVLAQVPVVILLDRQITSGCLSHSDVANHNGIMQINLGPQGQIRWPMANDNVTPCDLYFSQRHLGVSWNGLGPLFGAMAGTEGKLIVLDEPCPASKEGVRGWTAEPWNLTHNSAGHCQLWIIAVIGHNYSDAFLPSKRSVLIPLHVKVSSGNKDTWDVTLMCIGIFSQR